MEFLFEDLTAVVRERLKFIVTKNEIINLVSSQTSQEGTGKSGSQVYSNDRIFVKSLTSTDEQGLKMFLPKYVDHILVYGSRSLLPAFFRIIRYDAKTYVVMKNFFKDVPTNRRVFDLKGSFFNRCADSSTSLKLDNNFRGRTVYLPNHTHHITTYMLQRDVDLLQRLYLIDYSLLVIISETEFPRSIPATIDGENVFVKLQIVDVLLIHNFKKIVEHNLKGKGASSTNRNVYAGRFVRFFSQHFEPDFAKELFPLKQLTYEFRVKKAVDECRKINILRTYGKGGIDIVSR